MLTLLMAIVLHLVSPIKSIYDVKVNSLEGEEINFADFKGKKILIVNTASKCGFTTQYKELEQLHKLYGKNLVVIGFPANNFGNQEPGTSADIQEFCERNYGVTFLMADKVEVKGDLIHPLFKYLIAQENPDFTGDINWNFEKFLINEEGKLIHRYRSKVSPMDQILTDRL